MDHNLIDSEHSDTGFIGRDGLMRELRSKLNDFDLVTIYGQGGTGKTALATELAWRLVDEATDENNEPEFFIPDDGKLA